MIRNLFIPSIIFLIFLIIALAVLAIIFWIFMLIDCAKRNFKNDNEKIAWIIIIALLQFLGAVVYYFVIKYPNNRGLSK